MHRAERQRTGDRAGVAHHVHGAHAEVDRKRTAQRRDSQAPIRVYAFDHHGDLILMGHDSGCPAFRLVGRNPGRFDSPDEIVSGVLPDGVAASLQLSPAHLADLLFLACRPSCKQKFFQ